MITFYLLVDKSKIEYFLNKIEQDFKISAKKEENIVIDINKTITSGKNHFKKYDKKITIDNIISVTIKSEDDLQKIYNQIINSKEKVIKYIYNKKFKTYSQNELLQTLEKMFMHKSNSLLYDYVVKSNNPYFCKSSSKESESNELTSDLCKHSLLIRYNVEEEKFQRYYFDNKNDDLRVEIQGLDMLFFNNIQKDKHEENFKKIMENYFKNENKPWNYEDFQKTTYFFDDKNIDNTTPDSYFKNLKLNYKNLSYGEEYKPILLFSLTNDFNGDKLKECKDNYCADTIKDFIPENEKWSFNLNIEILYNLLMSEKNIRQSNDNNKPLAIINISYNKMCKLNQENNDTFIFMHDNYEVDQKRYERENEDTKLEYIGVMFYPYPWMEKAAKEEGESSNFKKHDTFPYYFIFFVFFDSKYNEYHIYNGHRGYRVSLDYFYEREKTYYSELRFIYYLLDKFPKYYKLFLDDKKFDLYLYHKDNLDENIKNLSEVTFKMKKTKVPNNMLMEIIVKKKPKVNKNLVERIVEEKSQDGGNIMIHKDVHYLDFKIDINRFKSLKKPNTKELVKIPLLKYFNKVDKLQRREIFIKNHSYLMDLDYKHDLYNTKKEEFSLSIIKSLSKFGLTIDHVVFIKMFLKLDLLNGRKETVLIQSYNNIMAFSMYHYALLFDNLNIIKNIYVKNLLDNFLENLKSLVKIKNFDKSLKYDIMILDITIPSKDITNIPVEETEINHLDFLFKSVHMINRFLKEKGTVLVHFYFFSLSQTIDYIRLISHYFENTKINDYVISARLGGYFVCFESYSGVKIHLPHKFFSLGSSIEKEELEKLAIIKKQRFFLQKKIIKFHFEKYVFYNNSKKEKYKQKKIENGIKLLKSIGYGEYDIRYMTLEKKINLIKYFKDDSIDLICYNFIKEDNLTVDKNIIKKIELLYQKSIIPFDVLDRNLYLKSKQNTRFFKNSLKYLVNKKLNVKHVSQSWCKALEMYHFIFNSKTIKEMRSYHLAEYPGNFIKSLEYFCYSNKIHLEWKAQSLKNSKVKDIFGFARMSKQCWDYAPDKTGDLLKKENQLYYINSIKSFAPNFMTADGGLEWKDDDMMTKLFKSEVNIILNSLKIGGSCTLRIF